jgi:hypothetical protein
MPTSTAITESQPSRAAARTASMSASDDESPAGTDARDRPVRPGAEAMEDVPTVLSSQAVALAR